MYQSNNNILAPQIRKTNQMQRRRLSRSPACTKAKPEKLRLTRDRQFVLAVDHFFPPSNPALPSSPANKSFSSVSCPIFACSVLTSTAGAAGSALDISPKNPVVPWSWSFHCLIWFAYTSTCSDNSTSVYSLPMAESATFALKMGMWFRRGRFVMVSPASGIQAKVMQKFHLSQLCSFPEPPLNSNDFDERTHHRHTPGTARDQSLKFQLEEKAQNSVNSPLMRSTGSVRRPTVSCFAPRRSPRLPE